MVFLQTIGRFQEKVNLTKNSFFIKYKYMQTTIQNNILITKEVWSLESMQIKIEMNYKFKYIRQTDK